MKTYSLFLARGSATQSFSNSGQSQGQGQLDRACTFLSQLVFYFTSEYLLTIGDLKISSFF